MAEEKIPEEVVRGWRALHLGTCTRGGNRRWVFKGIMGMHVHSAKSPLAEHYSTGIFNEPPIEHGQGVESLPKDCMCGYYGLFVPDEALIGVGWGRAIVWAQVLCLGPTWICDSGFRTMRYQIERIFWPCESPTWMTPVDINQPVYEANWRGYLGPYDSPTHFQTTLAEAFRQATENLDVEIVRRPLGVWLKERDEMDGLIESASRQLEAGP
jgi:hypothetical protein